MTEINLRKGMMLTMSDLQAAYFMGEFIETNKTMSMRMHGSEKH